MQRRSSRPSTSNAPAQEDVARPERMGPIALSMPNNLHPWLQFHRIGVNNNQHCEKFLKLNAKQFVCPRVPDWRPLEQAGIAGSIRTVLTTRYDRDDGQAEYNDWVKLFDLWMPIYKELCLELLTTIKIKEVGFVDVTDRSFMTFHLGGMMRYMSYMDIAAALRLYTEREMRAPHFVNFLQDGNRTMGNQMDIWDRLSDAPYGTSGNHVSDINDVNLRVIQRFLSHTITARGENTERVSLVDMWYLEQLKDDQIVNIPYGVAWFLAKRAGGKKVTSPICGGHFITAIARFFNIDFTGLTLVYDPRLTVGANMYIKVKAVKQVGNTFLPWTEEPEQAEEEEEELPPGFEQGYQGGFEHQGGFQQPGGYEQYGGFQQQPPPVQHPDQPSWVSDLFGRFDGLRLQQQHDHQETYNQQQRIIEQQTHDHGVLQYNDTWAAHNIIRMSGTPSNFQPTPREYPSMWYPYGPNQPPPVYDEGAAAAEMEEELRRQREREQQERGFPYDYYPF